MDFIIFTICFSVIIGLILKIVSYRIDVEALNVKVKSLETTVEIYKAAYMELNKTSQKRKQIEIPKGTIEAVRYAMIHNHPDNGGNAEKFILYKNCYDKLTGGR